MIFGLRWQRIIVLVVLMAAIVLIMHPLPAWKIGLICGAVGALFSAAYGEQRGKR